MAWIGHFNISGCRTSHHNKSQQRHNAERADMERAWEQQCILDTALENMKKMEEERARLLNDLTEKTEANAAAKAELNQFQKAEEASFKKIEDAVGDHL